MRVIREPDPFRGAIERMEGLGERGQSYLRKFLATLGHLARGKVPETEEELREALSSFQEFYGLPSTSGQIDADTWEALTWHHCGVRDRPQALEFTVVNRVEPCRWNRDIPFTLVYKFDATV